MSQISAWVGAFRLKTLPLAFSCIFMGTTLAYNAGSFNGLIFALCLITTLLLQILSNLANDYGDAEKGTDNENRLGPARAVQSGQISKESMKNAVFITAILCLISGIALLWLAFNQLNWMQLAFFVLGLGAIAAAIKYTMGKNPYGYSGLGDLFVFLFFGLVGVLGTLFLQAQFIYTAAWLPTISVGLFSVGVLNLNNLRDIDNDEANGKITLAVRLGHQKARYYHVLLLTLGWICMIYFTLSSATGVWQWLFLLSLPLFYLNGLKALKHQQPQELIPSLKQLALSTFLFCILYGLGSILVHV